MSEAQKHTVINEILPKAGLVYSEKGNLSEVLCKPKIMPLKSSTLQKIETIEKGGEAEEELKKQANTSGGGGSSGGVDAPPAGSQNSGGGQSESMSFE